MTKLQFIQILEKKLVNLSDSEKNKTISYYSEIIDDMVENGLSEQEATAKLGHPYDIASKYIEENEINEIKEEVTKEKVEVVKDKLSADKIIKLIILIIGMISFGLISFILAVVDVSFVIATVLLLILFVSNLAIATATAFMYLGMALIVLGVCGLLVKPTIHLIRFAYKTLKESYHEVKGGN